MRISISKLIPIRFTKHESLIFQYCFEYIPLQYEMVFVGQFRWPIIKVQCIVKFFIMTMYSEMKWFTQAQNHGFSGLSRDVLLKAKLQTRQTYLYVHLDLSPSLTFSCLCFCVLAYHISKFSMKILLRIYVTTGNEPNYYRLLLNHCIILKCLLHD